MKQESVIFSLATPRCVCVCVCARARVRMCACMCRRLSISFRLDGMLVSVSTCSVLISTSEPHSNTLTLLYAFHITPQTRLIPAPSGTSASARGHRSARRFRIPSTPTARRCRKARKGEPPPPEPAPSGRAQVMVTPRANSPCMHARLLARKNDSSMARGAWQGKHSPHRSSSLGVALLLLALPPQRRRRSGHDRHRLPPLVSPHPLHPLHPTR
jgi:hypothetical protein